MVQVRQSFASLGNSGNNLGYAEGGGRSRYTWRFHNAGVGCSSACMHVQGQLRSAPSAESWAFRAARLIFPGVHPCHV